MQSLKGQLQTWQRPLGAYRHRVSWHHRPVCNSSRSFAVAAVSSKTAKEGVGTVSETPTVQALMSINPENYEEQLQEKILGLKQLFSGFNIPEIEVFRSQPINYRMRTEFR
jgi:tRNA/tmRNA/rRNA uracil-C5-methylase (TrmA/RlmC/RlmD family)